MFVMHKIYVLVLCDHIQLKLINIMGVCIVAQVLLISSVWHIDNIKNEHIKSTAHVMIPIYKKLFNLILDCGIIPES